MDSDNSNDIHSSSESSDEFWSIIQCAQVAIQLYQEKYLNKTPYSTSEYTGMSWMREILEGHHERCRRMMRMERNDFLQLCSTLENSYELNASRNTSVIEKVGIFIFTLAQGASNRAIQERFQHSGETISRIFHEVLKSVWKFAKVLIEPDDRDFANIPKQILYDNRYMPHFKDCIGAIGGTHIDAVIPIRDKLSFIGRKGRPTQNILAVCSFDMRFIYVLAGFEGSAHDARVLLRAINTPNLRFPHPPPGKYYLVDAGYTQMRGYLGPYRGVRYHLQEYQQGRPPQGLKEVFNKTHSSLRSCIERCFGVWKKKWDVLRDMPSFPYRTQVKIVVATMTLHNYIRQSTNSDEFFQEVDASLDLVVEDNFEENETNTSEVDSTDIDMLRNQIALSIMASNV